MGKEAIYLRKELKTTKHKRIVRKYLANMVSEKKVNRFFSKLEQLGKAA